MGRETDDRPEGSPEKTAGRGWIAPAAAVAGLAALVVGGLKTRPAPRIDGPRPSAPQTPRPAVLPEGGLPREYALADVIGGASSLSPFRRSLDGVAVGSDDRIHALGDGEIRVFATDGTHVRTWPAPEGAQCLTVGRDGRVFVAGAGRVDVFSSDGSRTGGFPVGEGQQPASLTAIKVSGDDILVGDASARLIRRLDATGRQVGLIGDRSKTRAFILPNGNLDLAVDPSGLVWATDSGRHQVTSWTIAGEPVGKFGKFGMQHAADFTGCCNPVNIAITADGKIVTAEKAGARVKVFEPDGTLLALIGHDHFDQSCTQIRLAGDSKGRILAADTVRREIRVFAPGAKLEA